VVTHLNSQAGSDLEFPLGRHDLGVDTGDLDTSVQAGAVVGLDDVTGKDLAGTWRSQRQMNIDGQSTRPSREPFEKSDVHSPTPQ
jgi:hypothetical protein